MAEDKDIWRRVQEQLDKYSFGFPATESGVEIAILKELFTEQEAALFAEMTGELETPASVAARLGRPVEEMAEELERMACKGQLYRVRQGGEVRYSAIPFIHGLLEFRAPTEPKELINLTGKYIKEKLHRNMAGEGGGGGMRVLPIEEALDVKHAIASYDDAMAIFANEELIVVTDCSCRLQRKPFNRACDSPLETCIMVGPMAEYYLDNKMGRRITLEEARQILRDSHAAGLVTQTQSVTRPFMICNCCNCCCGFLGAIRRTPIPAHLVVSNHRCRLDESKCNGCGECLKACQVAAISLKDKLAVINYDRCIGCGLCVPRCPEKAMFLEPKPPEQHHTPQLTLKEQALQGAEKRFGRKIDPKDVVTYGYE